PVIANYGMDNLRFVEPVKIGDTIQVELTCKQKTPKALRDPAQKPHGVVVWDIKVKRSEEHTSELQSRENLVCRLLLEKKKWGDYTHRAYPYEGVQQPACGKTA